MVPVTQLYISCDAATKDDLKAGIVFLALLFCFCVSLKQYKKKRSIEMKPLGFDYPHVKKYLATTREQTATT